MLLIKKITNMQNFYINNNSFLIFFKKFSRINIGDIIYIKYFLIFKKKRKIFKFYGLCLDKTISGLITLRSWFNKENLRIKFFFYNPYLVECRRITYYPIRYKIKKLYFKQKFIFKNYLAFYKSLSVYDINFFEVHVIQFLANGICSQYYIKKNFFLFKTRYRFR